VRCKDGSNIQMNIGGGFLRSSVKFGLDLTGLGQGSMEGF
jgi:hypothetical protein